MQNTESQQLNVDVANSYNQQPKDSAILSANSNQSAKLIRKEKLHMHIS